MRATVVNLEDKLTFGEGENQAKKVVSFAENQSRLLVENRETVNSTNGERGSFYLVMKQP